MKICNTYKVSKRQWKKWNIQERELFNSLYSFSKINYWIFSHPKAKVLGKEHWDTVAWNHAWMASDLVREQRKLKDA